MHAFLIICVLAEAATIAFLYWKINHAESDCARAMERTNSANLRLDALCSARASQANELLQVEAKVSDLAEGTAKLDLDFGLLSADMRELAGLRATEAKELNQRITELAEEQEKIRRKAARSGPTNSAFENARTIAENSSLKNSAVHKELVALAEG